MMLTENPEEEQIDANILKATMVLDIHWMVTKVREHILQWLKRSGDTGPLSEVQNLHVLFLKGWHHI